jgi:hypothetical protein
MRKSRSNPAVDYLYFWMASMNQEGVSNGDWQLELEKAQQHITDMLQACMFVGMYYGDMAAEDVVKACRTGMKQAKNEYKKKVAAELIKDLLQ